MMSNRDAVHHGAELRLKAGDVPRRSKMKGMTHPAKGERRCDRRETGRSGAGGRCGGTLLGVGIVTASALAQTSKTPADPMKEPLELSARAKATFAKVKDYSCRLIKRETPLRRAQPQPRHRPQVRHEPFSVSMVWQEPKDLEGQEVVYVAGKHDNKMRREARRPARLRRLHDPADGRPTHPQDEQAQDHRGRHRGR